MKRIIFVLTIIFMVFLISERSPSTGSNYNIPEGVYIKLINEFYNALKSSKDVTYSNDTSLEYLRQIAINTKFMVETNLQILRQQEQIIKLLEKK